MHRLVSPFILDRHAAGETSGRFEAAALFVDVSGFSAMTSALMAHGQHGAEVLATVMRAIFDPLVEAVYAYGGFITVFAGDAFTAVFPAGAGRVGNLPYALAAAWTMREHMRAHPSHVTPYGTFTVSAKIGLAAGEVDWGIIRSEDHSRAAFYFRGPAIDACARAEQAAARGDLLLHASAHTLLADQVAAEPVGDYLSVSGLSGAQPQPQPVNLPAPDPETLAHFYPRAIIEQTQTGEFRQAINVFIGLERDPTDAQLAQFVQTVFKLQVKYGGLLNRLDFGDKGCSLLLFWGAPVSHENDVLRALNFLLELQDQAHLTIRSGITSRISHAGFIGSALHEEYTCYGAGVNLAARLMTSASWESIWLDEPVRTRAEHDFEIAPEGHLPFKGFREEQAVYSLLGRKTTDVLDFYDRKMVGRAADLAVLEEFVRPIFRPAGEKRFAGILVVRGEAGIGKSRLIHDFQTQHLPAAAATTIELVPRWCLCQSDQIVRQSLNPFRYWLQDYFGQSPTQTEAHNKRVFSYKLGQLLNVLPDPALRQEVERTRSILGALVGLYWEDSLYASLNPQSRYENTLNALKSFIIAESLRQPLLLHLEDVHWLDDDSIAFMQRLVRDIEPYPIAILAAARPEGDAPLFGPGVDYQIRDLVGLSDEDLVTLAQDILGRAPGSALLRLLSDRADGNPFFAEQILFYLRDEKQLEFTPAAVEVRGQALAAAPLPGNVRAIFIARLDRLAHDVREVVQSAAVLGREFEVQVLARMLHEQAIRPWVEEAEHAAIWTHLTEVRYLFKHVLLRDAAYDMQVRARRAELHRLAAEALAALYAAELPAHYAEIAYHYEAAYQSGLVELATPARTYLTRAGEQAESRYENAAAADYFTRALALVPEDDLTERYHLMALRESPMGRVDTERQRADIEAMQALAEALQDAEKQMEALLRRSVFAERTSDWAGNMAYAQRLVAMAHAAGSVHYEGEGYFEWGVALFRLGKMQEARAHFAQALPLAQQAKHEGLEGDCLLLNSNIEDTFGDPEAAERLLDQAMAKYQAAHNIYGEKAVYIARGELFCRLGRYAEAQANLSRMLEISIEQGARMTQSMALSNLGMVAIGLGDYTAARTHCEKAIRLAREVSRPDIVGEATWRLGLAALRQGNLAAARAKLEEGLAIVREVVAPDLETQALSYLGLLDSFEGSHASAQGHGQPALQVAREVGNKGSEALALVVLGHAQMGRGQLDEAAASYRSAAEIRQAIKLHNAALEARAGLARVALARSDVPAALAEIQPIADHLSSVMLNGFATQGALRRIVSEASQSSTRLLADDVSSAPQSRQPAQSGSREAMGSGPSATGASPQATGEASAIAHGLDGADDPLWVWLTWYQAWQAAGDPRAADVLAHAHGLLQAEIARIEDADARRMYMENIPYRREIVAAFDWLAGRVAAPFEASTSATPPCGPASPVEPATPARLAEPVGPAMPGLAVEPGADLSGADLHGRSLAGANLRGVDLTGANLRAADLGRADLRGADLRNADLRGATLAAADVRGADFTGANLRGADFSDIVYDASTCWPEGFKP